MIRESVLQEMELEDGSTIWSLSQERAILLVFLRHLGCVFCREAMQDIGKERKSIEAQGHEIILVHMESNETAKPYFQKFGLDSLRHISDPNQHFYHQFGLIKGSFSQLFGFKTMVRGFQIGISLSQLGGSALGDAFQMPGVFVIHQGDIKAEYIHNTVSDRPNYMGLLDCCDTGKSEEE